MLQVTFQQKPNKSPKVKKTEPKEEQKPLMIVRSQIAHVTKDPCQIRIGDKHCANQTDQPSLALTTDIFSSNEPIRLYLFSYTKE